MNGFTQTEKGANLFRPVLSNLKVNSMSFPRILLILCAVSCTAQKQSPRIVDLKASDGTLLKASYFAAGKAGPGVLLLHQCNQQRKLWDPLAQALNSVGINVLTVDYRGFGESGGARFEKLTPQEINTVTKEVWPGDIDIAYRCLLSQPGVQHDKIGAGGASCGVENSIQLAIRHPEVKVLMLLAGPVNSEERRFLRQSGKVPVFTGAADDDAFDSATLLMQWIFSLSSNPASRFQRYATGGHAAEMFVPHPDFPVLIAHWFEATLGGQPSAMPQTNGSRLPASQLEPLELMDQPDGVNKAVKMLTEAHERDPKADPLPQFIVNALGYEHLQSGDNQGAIEILKLNVTVYPNSPNAYDSLGDAYLADGQKDLARSNAKKALELLADDNIDNEQRKKGIRENAELKLKQLGP